jgi:hypothetical protein
MSTPTMSAADIAAHEAASYVRKPRTVVGRVPASHPRGSWPAEEKADQLREQGQPAEVVMDLPSDSFLVIVEGGQS